MAALIQLDTRARDAIVQQLHLEAVEPGQKRLCVVEGPPGAGKSTLVRRVLEINATARILYLTLNSSLVARSAADFAHEPRISCSTLDAITYVAAAVLFRGKVVMSEMSTTQQQSDPVYKQIDAWASMTIGGDLPATTRDVVDRVLDGDEDAQRSYLSWPLLRRLVLDAGALRRLCAGEVTDEEFEAADLSPTSLAKYERLRSANIVIVDEAQDLEFVFTKLLLEDMSPYFHTLWMGDRGQTIYADGSIDIFSLCLSGHKIGNVDTSRLAPFYKLFRSFRVPSNVAPLLRLMGSGPFVGNDAILPLEIIPEKRVAASLPDLTGDVSYLFHLNKTLWHTAMTSDFDDCSFRIHDFDKKCELLLTKMRDYEREAEALRKSGSKKRPLFPTDVGGIFGRDATLASVTQAIEAVRHKMHRASGKEGPTFVLSTVHSQKGAEFETWRIGDDVWEEPRNAKKQRRIQNVALTRGTKRVIVDGDVGEELCLLSLLTQLPLELCRLVTDFVPRKV